MNVSYYQNKVNQLDKERIVAGFKNQFTIDEVWTGKDFCTVLGIDYDEDIAMDIMLKNLVCHDFFTWNFEEWREMTEEEIKKSKKK